MSYFSVAYCSFSICGTMQKCGVFSRCQNHAEMSYFLLDSVERKRKHFMARHPSRKQHCRLLPYLPLSPLLSPQYEGGFKITVRPRVKMDGDGRARERGLDFCIFGMCKKKRTAQTKCWIQTKCVTWQPNDADWKVAKVSNLTCLMLKEKMKIDANLAKINFSALSLQQKFMLNNSEW